MKKLLVLFLVMPALLSALTLDDCLRLAKENNSNLRASKEDIAKADQLYNQVKGNLLPQVYLNGSYSLKSTLLPDSVIPPQQDFSSALESPSTANEDALAGVISGVVNSMIPEQNQKEGAIAGQVKMDQVLFMGGKLINGIRVAKKYRTIQSKKYTLQEQDLVYQTEDLFYKTLLAKQVLEIQKDALTIAQQHLTQVMNMNKEGLVSDYDKLRAQLEVSRLTPAVIQAQNNYDLALEAMKKQIGWKETVLTLEGTIQEITTLEQPLDTSLLQAQKQRIELDLSQIGVDMMQVRFNAEKGNYLPNIGLSAEYDIYTKADEYAIQSDDFGHMYQVGIGVQIPLFTGLVNTSKRAYARHDWMQSKYQNDYLQDMISLEVKQSLLNLQHARENQQAVSENVKLAEKGLQIATARYEQHVGIQLEVFDAQLQLNAAKLTYMQALYETIMANERFKKSIGILL